MANVEMPFSAFLRLALHTLDEEMPAAYERLRENLFCHPARIRVGGETLGVVADQSAIRITDFSDDAEVELWSDRGTILDLIDGRTPLLNALREDRLHVRGEPTEVVRFFEALQLFVKGGTRCPSMPALLVQYRS